jgi:protein-S-isoprenylcysteine O-methyltransferase Ste14
MKKVHNWSILTGLLVLACLLTMGFSNRPAVAWIFAVLAMVCCAFALIRFEERLLS